MERWHQGKESRWKIRGWNGHRELHQTRTRSNHKARPWRERGRDRIPQDKKGQMKGPLIFFYNILAPSSFSIHKTIIFLKNKIETEKILCGQTLKRYPLFLSWQRTSYFLKTKEYHIFHPEYLLF